MVVRLYINTFTELAEIWSIFDEMHYSTNRKHEQLDDFEPLTFSNLLASDRLLYSILTMGLRLTLPDINRLFFQIYAIKDRFLIAPWRGVSSSTVVDY